MPADFEADHPYIYVANPSTELAVIGQAVADFDGRSSTYVADAYAELELIGQAGAR